MRYYFNFRKEKITRKSGKILLWLVIFTFCHFNAYTQVITTEGREFWFGFMENHFTSEINLEVYISAPQPTSGSIEMPYFGWSMEFYVSSDTSIQISVPLASGMPNGSEKIENRGIHILTEKNVSVYALNKRIYSADATVILPVEALGKSYRVISYKGLDPSRYSEFLIVGIEDGTEVEITPSQQTRSGRPANIPFTILLNQGQTFQVQSLFDLTGTKVTSKSANLSDCKNFALYSGNEWTNVGGCGGAQDHLYEQMLPVKTWGSDFIIVPFKSRNGDIIRIVADSDSTTLSLKGKKVLINAGEFHEEYFTSSLYLTSDKPIFVIQFSRSQSCDNLEGDPFMVAVSPTEQLLKKVTFNALDIHVIDRYYVNIITKSLHLSSITLDGVNIGDQFTVFPDNDLFATASVSISKGNHTLLAADGFIAYVYGFGNIESFGYSAGASLDNLNFEVLSFDKITGEPASIIDACVMDEVPFRVNADQRFIHFAWDFGDGTTGTGDSLTHHYSAPGEYLVKVVASTSSGTCGYEEEAAAKINVLHPNIPILGPPSVCPDTPGVWYFADSNDPLNNYQWFVEGGSIQTILQDSIAVDWGPTNDAARVKLLTTNSLGCTGDTTRYTITINLKLEPIIPLGTDSLCASDRQGLLYYVYDNPTSLYTWSIGGGSVLSGQGTSQIEVTWDGFGAGTLAYEETSTLSNVCGGFSDTLSVFIEREPLENLVITAPGVLDLGDTLFVSFAGDTLFNFMSWDFGNGYRLDSIPVSEHAFYRYNCPGTYPVSITTYTGTLCPNQGLGTVTIQVNPPELELVSVSHTENMSLELQWLFNGSKNYQKEIKLRRTAANKINWKEIGSFSQNTLQFDDPGVNAEETVYQYYLETNLNCPVPVKTEVHQNILLMGENLTDPEGTGLQWNEYIGWPNGVATYEVWQKTDEGVYALLTETNIPGLNMTYLDEGFTLCYKIKAHEQDHHEAVSWSNERCLEFIPEIITYNVMTPNGDNRNDNFYIKNIAHYPRARLTIVNRYGNKIYQAEGYQNQWMAENITNGVYYYLLELNEPRNPIREIKGTITILK
ncbi:MAG: gliding motility-associated C-terminal domain-containing protein [Cyclobacteriaceae bacterium]|nr:gliding motility-associated C-terminal domain-containing protein [Cyclobacteriaceae bacterium]